MERVSEFIKNPGDNDVPIDNVFNEVSVFLFFYFKKKFNI